MNKIFFAGAGYYIARDYGSVCGRVKKEAYQEVQKGEASMARVCRR